MATSGGIGEVVRVGIAGVRGYKGLETARLVARHPRLRVVMVASDAMAGHRLRDLDRELVRDGGAQAVGYNDTISAARDYGVDLLFLATEPELCGAIGQPALDAGIRVVDLSGAQALRDADEHAATYGFPQPVASREAVFGFAEGVGRAAIGAARLAANPGAYATAVLVALHPLARVGLIEPGSVVVDAKAGTTTAGRKARISLLFSEIDNNCAANKIDRHQYTPEIVQMLAPTGGGPRMPLTLATHLLPMARGVLATTYLRVAGTTDVGAAVAAVRGALREAYADAPFVRVAERAEDVHLRAALGTNRALVGATADPWGGRVVIVSALDNLGKGTAGQAIQNANIMLGLDETLGLELGTGARP
jgi:N-acetyl-gamma-glutamyl-phosphate reductase